MRPLHCLSFLFLATALWSGEPTAHKFQAPHMGCLFTFKLVTDDPELAKSAAQAGFARLAELDAKFTDYQPTSELSKLSATAGLGQSVALSLDLAAILQQSQRFWKWSDGSFDITLGACTHLWRSSRKSTTLPAPSALAAASATVGMGKLKFSQDGHSVTLTQPGTLLDLGGIGKGFALDEITRLLKTQFHLENFLLDAAGQLAAIGHPPARDAWGLAIEKLPSEPEDAPTLVLKLRDRHLATSGGLHQNVTIDGHTYAHIINPQTGLGLTYTVQASVIAPDATTADAATKAACLLPADLAQKKFTELPNVEARVLRQAPGQPQTTWQTPGWSKYLAPATP